jgi:hypothetical protein
MSRRGFLLIFAYRKRRNHSPTIKPISSDKNMRQRRANILMEEDRRRFEKIFLPYLDAAYNLARWIIRHDQDAQDVVQDAYIRALKGFHLFRGGNSRGWLMTIVRNTGHPGWHGNVPAEPSRLINHLLS